MWTYPTTLLAGGAAEFVPTDVANCIGWWDFADTDSLTQVEDPVASGDFYITQVADKSDEGNDIDSHVDAARPQSKLGGTPHTVNGLQTGLFNTDALANFDVGLTDTAKFAFFIVYTDTYSGAQYPFAICADRNSPHYANYVVANTSTDAWEYYDVGGSIASMTGLTGTDWADPHIYTVNSFPDTSPYGKLYFDGVYNADFSSALVAGSTATAAVIGNIWGNGTTLWAYAGQVCEAILYDTDSISDADIARVHTYLSDKWGV